MSVDSSHREISTATLRRHFDVLMAHLEDTGRGTVPLPNNGHHRQHPHQGRSPDTRGSSVAPAVLGTTPGR